MLQSNVVVRESYHDGIETSMLSIDDGKAMVDAFGVNLLDFGFHNVCLVPVKLRLLTSI
jgi:hypothetical protein